MTTNNAWNSLYPAEVEAGGTGKQSFTAYAPIVGGITTTGNLQSADTNFNIPGRFLMTNGTGLLPTWQTFGGGSINIQVFEKFPSPTPNPELITYTPTPGTQFIIVEVIGAGGGGAGGAPSDLVSPYGSCGGGGGGGEYRVGAYNLSVIGSGPQTCTFYNGGTQGTPSSPAGGDGGDTSFGSLITAKGGKGGKTASAFNLGLGGDGGSGGTGGSFSVDGNYGGSGFFSLATVGTVNAVVCPGYGGAAGGRSTSPPGEAAMVSGVSRGGATALNWGGGGAGGASNHGAGGCGGGAGCFGAVIVTEFIGASGSAITFNWNEITSTSAGMASNNGYVANNGALVTLTLPASAALGDIIEIVGKGAGGWLIAQNALQQINYSSRSTTVGVTGSLASTLPSNSVQIVCTTAGTSTVWTVQNSVGNLTVV